MPDICRSLDQLGQKLTSLTFRLVLDNRYTFSHGQSDWKKTKEGVFMGDTSALIKVAGKKIPFKATVKDGKTFTINAVEYGMRKLPGVIMFIIGKGKEKVKIKFSLNCQKQEISVGDIYGVLAIEGFAGNQGLMCQDFAASVTNPPYEREAEATGAPNAVNTNTVVASSNTDGAGGDDGISDGSAAAVAVAAVAVVVALSVAVAFKVMRRDLTGGALISEYGSSETASEAGARRITTNEELSGSAPSNERGENVEL